MSESSDGRRLPEPDPLLVARAQERAPEGRGTEKSRKAFTTLYDAYSPTVFRRFCRTLGNREEAEIATQEVFIRVWDGLPKKKPDAPFVAWVFTIAINWERNHWRAIKRKKDRTAPQPEDPSPASVDVENEAVRRELVRTALLKLSPKAHQILLLHDEFGYSVEEIAHLLKISVPTAQKRLLRAHDQFKEVCDPLLVPRLARTRKDKQTL